VGQAVKEDERLAAIGEHLQRVGNPCRSSMRRRAEIYAVLSSTARMAKGGRAVLVDMGQSPVEDTQERRPCARLSSPPPCGRCVNGDDGRVL
jgi:hypothetical protein